MNVSDIATRIRRILGDTNSVEITDADIIRWVNDAQREIVVASELLQTKATTTPIIGTQNYIMPSDILKMHSVKYNGILLQFVSLEQAEQLFPNRDDPTSSEIGVPTHYWVWGGEVYLYPAPDAATSGSIICYYLRNPVDVSATSDTPEIPVAYHNRIVEYCLSQAYELDGNVFVSEIKMQEFQGNVQNMRSLGEWEGQETYPYITDLADFEVSGGGY